MADEKTSPNPAGGETQPLVQEKAGKDAAATTRKTVRLSVDPASPYDSFHLVLHEGDEDKEYALHLTKEFVEVFKTDLDEIVNTAAVYGVVLRTDEDEDQ